MTNKNRQKLLAALSFATLSTTGKSIVGNSNEIIKRDSKKERKNAFNAFLNQPKIGLNYEPPKFKTVEQILAQAKAQTMHEDELMTYENKARAAALGNEEAKKEYIKWEHENYGFQYDALDFHLVEVDLDDLDCKILSYKQCLYNLSYEQDPLILPRTIEGILGSNILYNSIPTPSNQPGPDPDIGVDSSGDY